VPTSAAFHPAVGPPDFTGRASSSPANSSSIWAHLARGLQPVGTRTIIELLEPEQLDFKSQRPDLGPRPHRRFASSRSQVRSSHRRGQVDDEFCFSACGSSGREMALTVSSMTNNIRYVLSREIIFTRFVFFGKIFSPAGCSADRCRPASSPARWPAVLRSWHHLRFAAS